MKKLPCTFAQKATTTGIHSSRRGCRRRPTTSHKLMANRTAASSWGRKVRLVHATAKPPSVSPAAARGGAPADRQARYTNSMVRPPRRTWATDRPGQPTAR